MVLSGINFTEHEASDSKASLDDIETSLFNEHSLEGMSLYTISKQAEKCGEINHEILDMVKSTDELTDFTLLLRNDKTPKALYDVSKCNQACQNDPVLKEHANIVSESYCKYKCGSCEYENKDKNATGFCLTCEEPEPLCDECSLQHLKQKLTRNHTLCNDLSKYGESRNFVKCEPCSFSDEDVCAEAFCLDCTEPEPMCRSCAQQHLKQKMSRGHQICNNIKLIPLIESVRKETRCIPCLYDKVDNIATSICFTCKDPEPMCNNCGKSHEKQQQTRGHEVSFEITKALAISKDLKYKMPKMFEKLPKEEEIKNELSLEQESSKFKRVPYCDPCLKNDHQTPASGVCYSCNTQIPFCASCIEDHLQINLFRNHKIVLDLTNVHRGIPDTTMNRY